MARKAADYTRRRKPVPCTQSWPLSAWKSVQEFGRTGRFLLSVPQVGRRPIQSRFHRPAFLLGALGPAIAPALASLYACHPRPVNTYHPFCHWCQCPLDADSATADHLVPRSRGGSNSRANLCLACHACNQKRRNRLPGEPLHGPLARRGGDQGWVVWTRYPRCRWRQTIRVSGPDKLPTRPLSFLGPSLEKTVLPEGQEPEQCPDAHGVGQATN
jgi:5-methylcytosine-specific restriction endonuclease McrA